MEAVFVLSIDQGTTGTLVSIFDLTLKVPLKVASSYHEFKQSYPSYNWVEHDLDEIWQTILSGIRESIARAQTQVKNFSIKKICAVGITNQRETLCIFDRKSGRPLAPAIV